MSAGTVPARRRKKQARLAPAAVTPVKTKKGKKARKAERRSVVEATLAALRGQSTRAEVAGEVGAAVTEAVPNPRLRWAAYNASAAAIGHGALWGVTGSPWAGARLMSDVLLSIPNCGAFVVTVGAAYAAYKIAKPFKGLLGFLAPVGAGIGAAFWGQGTAPQIAEFMAWSAPWSTLLAPLIVAGGVGFLCWLLLDSRAAERRALLRWLARIPLATVAVSSLVYTPGVLL
ncbi:hypothetical protein [Streptomyces sp. NPDC051546]|uniref:hypothetical protein n=1 Tax=Streptomyces sp. NPDC051546 TaxID=3365655 RepID=UPI0037902A97